MFVVKSLVQIKKSKEVFLPTSIVNTNKKLTLFCIFNSGVVKEQSWCRVGRTLETLSLSESATFRETLKVCAEKDSQLQPHQI